MFGRSTRISAGAMLAAGVFVSTAGAIPVTSVTFADGQHLDVQSVVGTGSNTAYLAVDFGDGLNEAWQYNYNGTPNGYTLLSDVIAATTLQADTTYYGDPYDEHFVNDLTDGSNTTVEYPALYFSPPTPGDPTDFDGTSSQGVTYEQAQVGIDDLNLVNGEIVAFDNSYDDVPVLPEVPEPATIGLLGVVGMFVLRRRR